MVRETIGELSVKVGLDDRSFRNRLNRLSAKFKQFGKGMTDVGKSISLKVTAPITALGFAAARSFGQFEKNLNRVRALTGATGESFDRLKNQAAELGRTTQFSASEAADAMGFLAQAGLEVEQITSALPRTLELAAAAQLGLAEAADIVTNVVTGLKLPIEDLARANDVLAAAAISSNTNVQQLGQAFKFVGPVATAAGLDLEEVTAILGQLGNNGIQASMAGTSLRRAISSLLAPTAKAAKVLKKLGVIVKDDTGKLRPFVDIIRSLETAGADAGDIFEIFGDRAGTAILTLVGQSDALANFTAMLRDSGGTAKRVANIQLEGLTGALTKMKSAVEGAANEIGEKLAPTIEDIAKGIGNVANIISNLNPTVITMGLGLAAAAAAIGPLILLTGQLTIAVGGLATAFAFLAANPLVLVIGAAIAAGVAIAAIGIDISNTRKEIKRLKEEQVALLEVSTRGGGGARQVIMGPAAFQAMQLEAALAGPSAGRAREALPGAFLPPGQLEILKETEAAFAAINTEAGTFGERIRVLREQSKVLTDGFIRLGEAGINPARSEFKLLDNQLAAIQQQQADLVFERLKDAMILTDEKAMALGDSYDAINEKTGLLRESIEILIESGFGAQSEAVQALVGQLNALTTSVDANKGAWERWAETNMAVATQFENITVNALNSVANAMAATLVSGRNFAQSMKSIFKSLATQIVAQLLKTAVTTIATKTAEMTASQAAENSKAPWPANLAAPAVTAAMVAALVALIPSFEHGGIISQPTIGLIGEAGPEAIIPLSGAGAGFQQTIIFEVDREEMTRMVVHGMPDVIRTELGFIGA